MLCVREDADTLHGELRAKGANVLGEPVSQPWGLRDSVCWTSRGTGSRSASRLSDISGDSTLPAQWRTRRSPTSRVENGVMASKPFRA